MNTMYLDKTFIKYGIPKKFHKEAEQFHHQNKSNILLGTRPNISNDCILAGESEEKVLATAFWEIILKDNNLKPIFLLWFNSTLGLLLL